MTDRAAGLPREVSVPREYLTLPPRFTLPAHGAVAYSIWLDRQRRGQAQSAGIGALGVTGKEWADLARPIARRLGRRVTVTVHPDSPAAMLRDWPATERERLLQLALDAAAEGPEPKPVAMVRRAVERLNPNVPVTAREAIIETADRLFVEHGINAVGVNLIVETVPTSRATFYKRFGSSADLTATVLERRHQLAVDQLAKMDARELGAVEALAEAVRSLSNPPGADLLLHAAQLFREDDHPARIVALAHRDWRAGVLRRLFEAAGSRSPVTSAAELAAAIDGASVMRQAGDGDRADRALSRSLEALL
ncbi:TetR/AcrR family transcriptional regulator [Mariniluteicoccus flavus]